MDTDVEIADHPEKARYEARLDGAMVGLAAYRLGEDVVTFTHTEVEPEQRHRGIGSALARFALDDARQRGLVVRPQCSFIRAFVEQNPEYAELVAGTPPP